MHTLPRKRGRSRKDTADLKPVILDAATQEFSAKGFDGARMEAIAKSAGVNVNLIYHYFGNKETLFVSVMEEAYRLIRSHHNDMNLRALDPEAAMADLVRSTFDLFSENPHLIGLLSSENLHEACHVKNSSEIENLYNPLLDFIRETLARGVTNGTFRDGVDPVELFITINAQSYFHLSNQHTLGFILHRDLTSPESLASRKEHVVNVVLSYLTSGANKNNPFLKND